MDLYQDSVVQFDYERQLASLNDITALSDYIYAEPNLNFGSGEKRLVIFLMNSSRCSFLVSAVVGNFECSQEMCLFHWENSEIKIVKILCAHPRMRVVSSIHTSVFIQLKE